MPWAKFDDRFNSHPKILSAGPLAVALHMRAIIYSAQHLTDGIIRRRTLNHIVCWEDDFQDFEGAVPRNVDLAKRLVNAGLWEEAPDGEGWQIHDYLDWNPSREQAMALSEARSEAGRKAGKASGASRRKKAERRTNAEPNRSASVQNRSSFVRDSFGPESAEVTDTAEDRLKSALQNPDKVCRREPPETPPLGSGDSEDGEILELSWDGSADLAEPNRSTFVRDSLNERRTKTNPVPVPVPVPNERQLLAQSEPQTPQPQGCLRPPAVVAIPLVSGEFSVYDTDIAEWQTAYPAVDVHQELRAMRQWSLANPTRRKTQRGARRFVNAWLSRQQNDGVKSNGRTTFADLTRAAMEWADAGDEQEGVHRSDE